MLARTLGQLKQKLEMLSAYSEPPEVENALSVFGNKTAPRGGFARKSAGAEAA
jgi:hypothetical protein